MYMHSILCRRESDLLPRCRGALCAHLRFWLSCITHSNKAWMHVFAIEKIIHGYISKVPKPISENIKAFHIFVFLCDFLSSALQHLSKREWELWFYPIETLIMPIEFIFSENPSEVIFSLLRQRCAIPFKMHLYLPFKVISREANNSSPETVKERGRGETGARDWFLENRARGETWILMLYWVLQSQIAGQ